MAHGLLKRSPIGYIAGYRSTAAEHWRDAGATRASIEKEPNSDWENSTI